MVTTRASNAKADSAVQISTSGAENGHRDSLRARTGKAKQSGAASDPIFLIDDDNDDEDEDVDFVMDPRRSTGTESASAGKPQRSTDTASTDLPTPTITTEHIPSYIIDLSLPPSQRYTALAEAYKSQLLALPVLFDEILTWYQDIFGWWFKPALIKFLVSLLLRRIYDPEQMEELRGFQKATGIEMYLLVAYNVLLDLFVGCTSGGVQVLNKQAKVNGASNVKSRRMMHFRTLDWGMDPLRNVVVELRYVLSPGGPVVASNVTYVGFVGLLTGVRKDLSVSFNFRSSNSGSPSRSALWRARIYKAMVLLGLRPSVTSHLRHMIVPTARKVTRHAWLVDDFVPQDLRSVMTEFAEKETSQCYIIACDGTSVGLMEKDWRTATTTYEDVFGVCTNHDVKDERSAGEVIPKDATAELSGMQEILEESVGRKQHAAKKFSHATEQYLAANSGSEASDVAITLKRLTGWMTARPIWADCTHYSVVMCPSSGSVVWGRRFLVSGDDADGEASKEHRE